MVCTFVDLGKYYFYIAISVKAMHISIADDLKKRFHAACAIRGLKMSQVITELIQQWLEKLTAKAVSPANSLIGLALGDSSRRLSEMSKV
ncbi:hypothetical protein NUACC21_63400 [Scytonema sp. NUACC21]